MAKAGNKKCSSLKRFWLVQTIIAKIPIIAEYIEYAAINLTKNLCTDSFFLFISLP
jgi:hypothetical protein